MPEPSQPPATLILGFCATCGWSEGGARGIPHMVWGEHACPGTVQTLTYRLDAGRPREDLRPATAPSMVTEAAARDCQKCGQELGPSSRKTATGLCARCRPSGQPEPQYEYRAVEADGSFPAVIGDGSCERTMQYARQAGGYVERRTAPGPWERLDVPDTTGEDA